MIGFVVGVELNRFRKPTLELWNRVELGDTQKTVRRLLADPLKEFDRATAP
jgi:hypothetical protein